MVGLVVVSHSRALAGAAVALAAEMVSGRAVRMEVAAGLDDGSFGTDAAAIAGAVTAADDGDGVVVLMDLGSAVLSAELALELLADDGLRERVVLCPGPLVEGLVVAAVTAAGGAGRAEVAAEAAASLAGKQGQVSSPADGGDEADAVVTVTDPHGLHARPAARLVTAVRATGEPAEIRNRTTGSPWVPAGSLSRVATLGASQGHKLQVRGSRAAVDAIVEALGSPAGVAEPQPVSLGIGIGPAWPFRVVEPEPADVPSRGPSAERHRIDEAVAVVRLELHRLRATTVAGIFDAHLLLLDDGELIGEVYRRIDEGAAAPQAWSAAAARVAAEFDGLADPYLRGRAADVRAVGGQVLRALLGSPAGRPAGSGVLIAPDLTPAEMAEVDAAACAGVLLAFGSRDSHAAVIARTRGIPAVAGAGPAVLDIPAGTTVALDGGTGEFVVDPDPAVVAGFRERARALAVRRDRASVRAAAAAITGDRVAIAVGANIGSVADARAAAGHGADHAGLVRTEFLFLGRAAAPDRDEQLASYREIAEALGGRRLTIRTLDVGGDKPLPYLPAAAEANPFLGVRGIRHSLAHPELLAEQLLAIVRVAREVPVRVMFPMVSVVAEVVRARRLLDEAIARDGSGRPAGLEVGIMIEVPAAALKTAAFVPLVDFVSIGTNDLTQYALAAERGNPKVAGGFDGLDPGVLHLIDAVGRGAGGRVPVAVCGELAADEVAVPLLIGLGVRELSVAPPAVPLVKEAVRAADTRTAAELAVRALTLPDAASVRRSRRPTPGGR